MGMNFKKYFSFWKTKGTSRFQQQSSKRGIKSVAAVHAVVSVGVHGLSVCMAAKPVMVFCSPVYSPKLAKAKLFRSPAVRHEERLRIF